MKETHIKYLICPECRIDLKIAKVTKRTKESIKNGTLICTECKKKYEIVQYIPRFVPLKNYASGFGLEWTKHARTQYDSYSGSNVSEKRFFEETKWKRNLEGEIILEVGSGSGRFTEQAVKTKAMVVSLDYSYAVDVNYASNGDKDNVLIVQGDIYCMPFKENFFDKIFCIGVLQHTPDVRNAFMSLLRFLKTNGNLVIDVYRKYNFFEIAIWLWTKYLVRPISKRMNSETLYKIITQYINLMWPIARIIHKLPFGRTINLMLLIADYRGVYDLDDNMLKEWATLDSFDMLSPAYDSPQKLNTVKQWFNDAGMKNIDVHYGYNGIEGHGTKDN